MAGLSIPISKTYIINHLEIVCLSDVSFTLVYSILINGVGEWTVSGARARLRWVPRINSLGAWYVSW